MGRRGGKEGAGASFCPATAFLDGGGAGAGLLTRFCVVKEPLGRLGGGGERTLGEVTEAVFPDLLGSGGGGGSDLTEAFEA